jgi:hypothetical protein
MDQRFQDFLSAEQARSEKLRELYVYWLRMRQDGRPGSRTAFDPVQVPRLLSSLLLGDIEPDPFRVYFRLVGTRVADFSRLDFSGRYLDALDYHGRDSVEWLDCYRHVHAGRTGVIGINRVTWEGGEAMEYEFAVLPLERNGDPAGSFVAIEDYDSLAKADIPHMPAVTVFQRLKD